VALLSRSSETSTGVAEEIVRANGKALVVQTDVTRLESVKNAVEKVRSELGQITALAYNASGYGRGGFLELDPKTIQQSFEVGVMDAVYLSQRVNPDMLIAGHGFISLTGATAALRGACWIAPLAVPDARVSPKASLRMLGQSRKGIHVVHVIVDEQIDTPKLSVEGAERASETLISPDSIAETILFMHKQTPEVWTHEIDLRPHLESF
jgi:NADP-dependent 3-hydroxy acid dehydrogenase YdfG